MSYKALGFGQKKYFNMKGFMQSNNLDIEDIMSLTGVSHVSVRAWLNSPTVNKKYLSKLKGFANYKDFTGAPVTDNDGADNE